MRAVGPEEDLQLDGLVHVETDRLELGFALDCRWMPGDMHCEYFKSITAQNKCGELLVLKGALWTALDYAHTL